MRWMTEVSKCARAVELSGLVGYASSLRNARTAVEAESAASLARDAARLIANNVAFWRGLHPFAPALTQMAQRADAAINACDMCIAYVMREAA